MNNERAELIERLADDYMQAAVAYSKNGGDPLRVLEAKADFQKAVAAALLEADAKGGDAACKMCGGSGWVPNRDAEGNRVWLPFMNDAIPCGCGALAKRIAAEKSTRPQQAAQAPAWQPIETAPMDGTPHVRGLQVDRSGFIFWEAHAGRINDETGEFEDLGGEHTGWDAGDYTHWTTLPAWPIEAAHGIGKDQARVGINSLTEAETSVSASVMGLTRKDQG